MKIENLIFLTEATWRVWNFARSTCNIHRKDTFKANSRPPHHKLLRTNRHNIKQVLRYLTTCRYPVTISRACLIENLHQYKLKYRHRRLAPQLTADNAEQRKQYYRRWRYNTALLWSIRKAECFPEGVYDMSHANIISLVSRWFIDFPIPKCRLLLDSNVRRMELLHESDFWSIPYWCKCYFTHFHTFSHIFKHFHTFAHICTHLHTKPVIFTHF